MKRLKELGLGLLILSINGYSVDLSQNIKASNAPYNQALTEMEAKSESKQMAAQQAAATQKAGSSEVMVIDPLMRAQDYKEAFNYLMQNKSGSSVYFLLQNNEKLMNVLDMTLMKGGTVIIFRINTTQGIRYRVVKTEDIMTLGN